MLVVRNSLDRQSVTKTVITEEYVDCWGALVWHIVDWMDRLLCGAGVDPAAMVHIGTNEKVRGRWSILKKLFQGLGNLEVNKWLRN